MNYNFIIIDDHQDILENLGRKVSSEYPNAQVLTANTCDKGFQLIQNSNHVDKIIILDLNFKRKEGVQILSGKELLKLLKNEDIHVKTIIYSSYDELENVFPIIDNYEPNAYVIKSDNSNLELMFAIEKVTRGEIFYSHEIHKKLKKRAIYDLQIDPIDELIISHLPDVNKLEEWKTTKIPLSIRAISDRIKRLCINLEVENEKQLLLKLQKLGFL